MTTDSEVLKIQAALDANKAEAARLEAQLKKAQEAAKSSVICQIKDLMKTHGITVNDLGDPDTSSKAKSPRKDKGQPAKDRYFNPKSPSVGWHGIGRPDYYPQWVKDLLASGDDYKNYKIEDREAFLAKQAAATSNSAQSALGI